MTKSSTEAVSEQNKVQTETPILAARPSIGKTKMVGNTMQDGDPGARSNSADVDDEMIRKRAYELWEQRGRLEGYQEEDWRRAEAELRGQQFQQAS